MSAPLGNTRTVPAGRLAVLTVCVLVIGIAVAWLYFAMRAVMDVGGMCADGGPYQIQTHCPHGTTLFTTVSVPLWFAGVFIGMFAAAAANAPTPILPAWFLLFGALGWNFLEYAFAGDGVEVGWLVCGIVFELMALPALAIFVVGRLARSTSIDGSGSGLLWTLAYVVVLASGWGAGQLTYAAWS